MKPISLLLAILCGFFSLSAFSQEKAPSGHLKVLTFNTWLLDIPIFPFGLRSDVSHDFKKRLELLPDALAKTDADILVLQEVWSDASKKKLVNEMQKRGYGYAAYTRASRWVFVFQTEMGDGLLVLSKFPISENVLSMQFHEATQDLEKYSSKGALKLQIKHPDLGWIDLYASHAGAVDFENGNYDAGQVERHAQQIQELAEFIQKTRTHAVTLLAADLNMHYQSWNGHAYEPEFSDLYQYLKSSACGHRTSLVDTYLYTHHKTARDVPDYTFSQKNPYVDHGYFDSLPNEVEDYLFVCGNSDIRPVDSSLKFKDELLSDHYGVETDFEFHRQSQPIEDTIPRLAGR